MKAGKGWFRRLSIAATAGTCLFLGATWSALRQLPSSLAPDPAGARKTQLLDRHGNPLILTYQNDWNVHDIVSLHEIPPLLRHAFIVSEDQRFYRHKGSDWLARSHAIFQNLTARRAVRGASTITEQVVRMIHPRPRTLWSRWMEGIEAYRLERHFSKAAILEFYLNQVPYARNRRGVAQAARDYFDRDLETLNAKEMLALVVLVRAPHRLDPRRGMDRIEVPLRRLAERLRDRGEISDSSLAHIRALPLELREPVLPAQAAHFARFVNRQLVASRPSGRARTLTTLDAPLQRRVQEFLDARIRDLRRKQIAHGAVLVVDNPTGEVLAWVNAGDFFSPARGSQIDAVTTPRQPGSTLKPFLYALALEKGWTAATIIDDSPFSGPVGAGLHTFHNYSRRHYGPLRLREALGNSLNVPAVRTADFVGPHAFLNRLRELGFISLTQSADHYGFGLALGNGEVTLFELVQAYSTLARKGLFRPLAVILGEPTAGNKPGRILTEEISSVISNILSDEEARQLEFGRGNLLRFPTATAVKTGTSSDYRDAWAIGFTNRHTVGVWLGNLDAKPTAEITGSIGPAVILRQVFSELTRSHEAESLYLSPRLEKTEVCRATGLRPQALCPIGTEWFVPGSTPSLRCPSRHGLGSLENQAASERAPMELRSPPPGLHLAMDPRIPDDLEAFSFLLPDNVQPIRTAWVVDGEVAAETGPSVRQFLWTLTRGTHTVRARVWQGHSSSPLETPPVPFLVK